MSTVSKISFSIILLAIVYAIVKVSAATKALEKECDSGQADWYIKEFKLDDPEKPKNFNWDEENKRPLEFYGQYKKSELAYHWKFWSGIEEQRRCYHGINYYREHWPELVTVTLKSLGKTYSFSDLNTHLNYIRSKQVHDNWQGNSNETPMIRGAIREKVKKEGILNYCELLEAIQKEGIKNAKRTDPYFCWKRWQEAGHYTEKGLREKFGLKDPLSFAAFIAYHKNKDKFKRILK